MTKAELVKQAEEQGIEVDASATKAVITEAIEKAMQARVRKAKAIKHQSSKEEGSLRDQGGSVVFVGTEADGFRPIEGVQGHGSKFTAALAEALGMEVADLLSSDLTVYTLTAANAYKSRPEDRS
jgi:aspartyl aminopeptidase